MSIHTIKMPDIGEGIAEVELVAWHVKPGDVVKEDQVLADVMTDKANVEIPSPVQGTVLALGGEVGQVLAVGSELIRIEVEEAQTAEAGAARGLERATAAKVMEPAGAPPSPAGPALRTQQPTAPATRVTRQQPAAVERDEPSPADRPIASPSVRRRAWELDIDLKNVRGSGLGGRIMHGDLELHVAKHGAGVRRALPAAAPVPTGAARHDEQQVPVIGVRRKIAQKMQEAKRRIPHFTYVEEIDVTELENLRARLNAQWERERGKLTLLPFLVRAVVMAVRDFPQVNARFDDDAGVVTRYGAVHLGIATQTDSGLMVPVLRHAESHDLWSSASEISRLSESARGGKVTRGELTGSTITITSLGALGGVASTPVINHPEVAIVGVNRIVERPAWRNGAVVPRQLMNLSSSFDHRVVDGVDAARFVQAIRALLEAPALLFVQ
ncbi:2-oxoisovalerate dehydrogenase E2 component (dihydrolipoyl transacylase) [Burkholderiaceae bacterium]|nr:2-oxoisovalerate dehydrogenase E2 component (dihydrolipoyl transacylase) [Burkholderiaceae bacterium]